MARLAVPKIVGISEKRHSLVVLMTLREEQGMTQETSPLKAGTTQIQFSLLERENTAHPLQPFIEISNALNISGADLVRRVENLLPSNPEKARALARQFL